jgi:hypothetical protein
MSQRKQLNFPPQRMTTRSASKKPKDDIKEDKEDKEDINTEEDVSKVLFNDDDEEKKGSKSLLGQYQSLLIQYPFLTNALTAVVIASASVITSQYFSYYQDKKNDEFIMDWNQVITIGLMQFFYVTPVLSFFYNKLLTKVPGGTVPKVVFDQFFFSPIFNSCFVGIRLFILIQLGAEKPHTMKELIQIVKEVAPTAITSSWKFWIPQRAFSLTFIPPHLQLVFGNVCSFFWNIIFAMILSSTKSKGN